MWNDTEIPLAHLITFRCYDGRLSARLTTTGGWLSFETRKLIVPPQELADVMKTLAKTEDFENLPSIVKN